MSYLSETQADQIVGTRAGWPSSSASKREVLERATQRIEVIPFETDPSPDGYSELATRLETRTEALQAAEGKHFRNRQGQRWTDGVSLSGELIPQEVKIATAELALHYSRNPLVGYHTISPEANYDTLPALRDLPLIVINALWAWMDPIFKSGVDETLPFQITPPAIPRITAVALSED